LFAWRKNSQKGSEGGDEEEMVVLLFCRSDMSSLSIFFIEH
jgi:hypothetical protein